MEREWYNVELKKDIARVLGNYLKENNILYEPSEAYNLVHFEIFMTAEESEDVNILISNLMLN